MPCARFPPMAARRCCAVLPAEKGFRDDEHRRQHAAPLAQRLAAAGDPAGGVGRPAPDLPRRFAGDHRRRVGPIAAPTHAATGMRSLRAAMFGPADRSAPASPASNWSPGAISSPGYTSARAVVRISAPTLLPAAVHRGALICRWHGLCLDGSTDEFGWRPLPSHDDGVLAWVRLDSVGGEEPLDQPVISARPTGDTLHAVTRLVGTCEPADIIANRLDPWHGAWYHPYSFTRLEVLHHSDRRGGPLPGRGDIPHRPHRRTRPSRSSPAPRHAPS